MRVGFIGLGNMGSSMARNLIRAGHVLTAYNRTRQRAEELAREGARVADSPAEAAAHAEVLITMVSDDHAVRSVMLHTEHGITPAIEALEPGAIHMCMSTISIECSKELEEQHGIAAQGYVAAPVIGRAEAARERNLWVVAGGANNHIERCRPLMDAIGKGVSVAGVEPWKANLTKIGVNFMLASMIEALGEAYALIEKYGLDPHAFLQILNGGAFHSPPIENYGQRIADRQYEPAGFSLALGLKDTELSLQAGKSADVPLPFANILRDHYLQALAHRHGSLDWAAVAEVPRHNAAIGKVLKAGG